MADVAEQEKLDERFSADPEIAAIEHEAVEELAATARRFVTKLPASSRWRDPLIDVSDLDAARRIAEREARTAAEPRLRTGESQDELDAYVAEIAARGVDRASERAALARRMNEASDSVGRAADWLGTSLSVRLEALEAHPDPENDLDVGECEARFDDALDELGDARLAAFRFLQGEGQLDGGERDRRIAELRSGIMGEKS